MSMFSDDLPKHYNLVHTVYKTHKTQYTSKVLDNGVDYHHAVCKEPVKQYEVLHIEHMLSVPQDDALILEACVRTNPKLYNNLYPRLDVWSQKYIVNKDAQFCKELMHKVRLKMHHNVFTCNKAYLIGHDSSYFNSSHNYNACTRIVNLNVAVTNFPSDVLHVLVVVALRDIQPGEEVLLYYPCSEVLLDDEVNTSYLGEAAVWPQVVERQVMKFVNDHTFNYLNTKMFQSIMLNQMMAFVGFFYHSRIYVKTDRLQELLKHAFYDNVSELEGICFIIVKFEKLIAKLKVHRSKDEVLTVKAK